MRDGPIPSWLLAGLVLASSNAISPAQESRSPEEAPPASLQPLEPLIGGWKGMAVPAANRLKGWPERHAWAWSFDQGRPSGLTATFEGSKSLRSARLAYDAKAKLYRLETVTPAGVDVRYSGTLDPRGQTLVLDREDKSADGLHRLTLRFNGNRIRYTWIEELKAPRSPQYVRLREANLGKEGETFAAGSSEANLPRCILTGGAASMTATHEGRSFPVCCSGCRDEFLASPEKYIARAEARARQGSGKPAPPPDSSTDDGGFGDVLGKPRKPSP